MKTHSSLVRLCLASLPAFALTLSAAENERRESPERPPEQREGRRDSRPDSQTAPRNNDRSEASPKTPAMRRPGGELSNELANRPDARANRNNNRGPNPQAQRPNNSPRPEGGMRPPMAGQHNAGHPQEREQHVRQAIEHLRMAGMNDVAENLQHALAGGGGQHPSVMQPPMNRQRARGQAPGQPNLQPRAGAGSPGRNFTPPMAGGSSNELRELHEQVAQLKKMVEELARQRR